MIDGVSPGDIALHDCACDDASVGVIVVTLSVRYVVYVFMYIM